MFVTLTAFINGNYLIFIYCVPLAFYHGFQWTEKKYKVYAVTREEYKPIKKDKMRCIEIKIAYYAMLIFFTVFALMMAAANMATYHLFGEAILNSKLSALKLW